MVIVVSYFDELSLQLYIYICSEKIFMSVYIGFSGILFGKMIVQNTHPL